MPSDPLVLQRLPHLIARTPGLAMTFFVRRCRDVSALILAAEDRSLSVRERLAVRLHLAMCDACTRFSSQVRLMHRAMPRWRRYRETDSQERPPEP
jgi:hypothetical protein